ncbi:MAG: hypothetical protein E7613_07935 [Ruminococcaceae bacterium]|nr:hypothetical protein [Oscillospiraceae bacterium]
MNAALNYGYAIVRGHIARVLANYGFEPCIGIHHCSGKARKAVELCSASRRLGAFACCNGKAI